MIQQMLEIWSLVPLPFLNPAWTSGSSQFMDYWSPAWKILSITLLACEMSLIVQQFECSFPLPFFGFGMKTDLFQLGLSGEAGPLGVMGQRIPYRGWGKQRILQVRLQQYRNWELQMFKLDLEKAEAPEIKLPTSVGSLKKQESSRKISALLTMLKPLTV